MMAGKQHILWGSPSAVTLREGLTELLATYAEGLIVSQLSIDYNAFHRPLQWTSRTDLTYLMGLSYQGIRSVGWVPSPSLVAQASIIRDMVTAQLPIVLIAEGTLKGWSTVAETGAVVWTCGSVQEAADRIIMAQFLAEQALVPVVVWVEAEILLSSDWQLPTKDAVVNYLGRPEQFIASPTPPQELIFGAHRPRVPHTYSPDVPVMLGSRLTDRDEAVVMQSRESLWNNLLPGMIDDARQMWQRLTSRDWPAFQLTHHSKDRLLISMGALQSTIEAANKNADRKERAAHLHFSQLAPFPTDAWTHLPAKAAVFTVLEPLSNHHPLALRCQADIDSPRIWIKAQYGPIPNEAAIQKVLHNATLGKKALTAFTIEVTVNRPVNSPKQQLRQQELERLFPESKTQQLFPTAQAASRSATTLPEAVRVYEDKGPQYSHLSAFYDHTVLLYEQGIPIDVDYISPRLPAESALLNNNGQQGGYPAFIPDRCTACGDCQVYCPHAAIPAAMLEWDRLLAEVVKRLTKQGVTIAMLMPVLKAWQQHCNQVIQQANPRPTQLEPVLTQGFTALAEQMGWKDDQLSQAELEKEALIQAIGKVPFSATDVHYFQWERQSAGAGALFTLAIDPGACTQCGICVAACPEDALQMHDRKAKTFEEVEQTWKAFNFLPDTSGDTVRRLVEDDTHEALSALTLSRHFYHSLSGGQPEDDGSAQKVLLHQVTTVAESLYQHHQQEAIGQLRELQKALDVQIQKQLSKALPAEHYETLLAALHRHRASRLPFDTIINEWGHEEHLRLIDTKTLERRAALAKDLQDLLWVLTEGPTGMGRSRYGVAVDAHQWGTAFPWNPWSVPAVVHGQMGQAGLVRGLWQGQVRHVLDNLRLVRRAALEAKNKYNPHQHDKEIAALQWADLTKEERAWVPPVLWVIDREHWAREDQQAIAQMWSADIPVKVVLLDHGAPDYDQGLSYIYDTLRQVMQALSTPQLRLVMTTLADANHLFKSLQMALHSSSPALMWLLAPDFQKHELASQHWPRLIDLAVHSGAFPLMDYNPDRPGSQWSSHLNLAGPVQAEYPWRETKIEFQRDGEPETMKYRLTWADFAYTMKDWQSAFSPMPVDLSRCVSVAEYLQLSSEQQATKTPVIFRVGDEKTLLAYQVNDGIVRVCRAVVSNWNLLRELAGWTVEHPEHLTEAIREELEKAYTEEIKKLQQQHATAMAEQEKQFLADMSAKIKAKLMALSQTPGS